MKKFAFLLPFMALSCAASMAAVTTTTTTTHTTQVAPVYNGPTIVTIHTHAAKRPARNHHVKHPTQQAASPNTRQLGGPPAPGTTATTTVRKHSVRYD